MSTKRILSLVLALVMVLGTFGTVFAAEPTENPKVDWLVEQGYVLGDEGGLRLEDGITRAEVSVIVAKALGLETEAAAMANIPSKFSDMNAGYAWANGFVNVLNANGYISGYPDGTFGPARDITYAEVASMLVRVMGGLTEAEAKNQVWPTTYLAKAASLGIFEGVAGVDYTAKAVRGKIFEMVYNTLDKEVGNNTVVKAIVLENSRVETLAKNEVVVEILKVEQVANYAKESRIEKGQQPSYIIDEKLGNVEDLLGQVASFTINKDGKVIKITPDTSYKVVSGPATATRNKINVNGTNYTVELDERYKDSDERIFRTYHNDNAFAYKNFFINPLTKEVEDSFDVDFARVTVKNGKVLLIDSFSFEDIAPVKEVKGEGAEVFAYNDARDGGIKRFDLAASAKVITVEDGKFSRATRANIDADDVLHAYKGGYIVRKDAKLDGTYEKISYSRDVDSRVDDRVYVNVDGEGYQVLPVVNQKPVYSYDAKQFFTLETKAIDSTLRDFKDEKVTLLLDINGNLQFLTSEMELGEFAAIVENVIGKEVRVLKGTDNTKADYVATFDSELLLANGTTRYQNLSAFDWGDVVYLSANDGEIDTMMTLVKNTVVGETVLNGVTRKDITSTYIKTIDGNTYRLLDRTNVFVRSGTTLKSTTISDVMKNYKVGLSDGVKVAVVTDKEYNAALTAQRVDFRRVNSNSDDVAHTIVFTEINPVATAYNEEIVKVLEKQSAGRDYVLRVQFSNNVIENRVVRKASIADVNRNDIVKLFVTKDDNKYVDKVEVLIATDANVYEVSGVSSGTGYRNITVKDAAGEAKSFWIFGEEFGYVQAGDKVSLYDQNDANKELEVIIVRPASSALSYWAGGSADIVADGVVSGFRYDSQRRIQFIEISKGNTTKEYEVRGFAKDFVSFLVGYGDEVKVILDGNYLVGFEYIKLSSDKHIGYTDDSGDFHYESLTVPAAWTGFILDGGVTAPAKRTITATEFIVDADYATIKNIKFIGDVTVSDKVANDFTANNVEVTGITTIAGGSSNTVELIGSTFTNLVVKKKDVRVALTDTTITNLEVNATGVKVEKDADSSITTVSGTETPAIDTVLEVSVSGLTYAGSKIKVAFEVKELGLADADKEAKEDVKVADVAVEIKNGATKVNIAKGEFDITGAATGAYVLELDTFSATELNAIKGKELTVKVTVKTFASEVATFTLLD